MDQPFRTQQVVAIVGTAAIHSWTHALQLFWLGEVVKLSVVASCLSCGTSSTLAKAPEASSGGDFRVVPLNPTSVVIACLHCVRVVDCPLARPS